MPLDSQGNYTLPPAPAYPAVGGETIQAAHFNTIMEDMKQAFNSMLLASGLRSMSGPLTMNNNLIKSISDAVDRQDAVNLRTLIKRAVFVNQNGTNLSIGSPHKATLVTGMNLTEYTTGMSFISRFYDFVSNSAHTEDLVKFKVDALPELDFRDHFGEDIKVKHLGTVTDIMVIIDYETTPTPKFYARLMYNTANPIHKVDGALAESTAGPVGVGKYLRWNYPISDLLFEDGLVDAGEIYSNAYRRHVARGAGSYSLGTLHGRGLYLLTGNSTASSTLTGSMGIWCEPNTAVLNVPSPTMSGVAFASTLVFPGVQAADIYKIF